MRVMSMCNRSTLSNTHYLPSGYLSSDRNNDILIYMEDLKHHHKIVREVLARLLKYDLYLKPEKCDFEKQEMEYLGMIITPGEVRMDPGKVNAVRNWPTPKT